MSYKVLSLSNKQEWEEYLQNLPLEQQDVYYTPEYYELYENYGDGKAMCFVFEQAGEIALYPFLINSVNVLGYTLDLEYYDIQGAYGYNGVLSSSYEPKFIEGFYAAFDKFARRKNIVAEFTRFHPILNNVKFSKEQLSIFFDRYTVYIDTNKSLDDLWSGLQRTTKKQINRGYNRNNLKVKVFKGEEFELDIFVSIYSESMKRVESTKYLYFNKDYFQHLLSLPQTIQYVAYFDEKPISTITALMGKNILHGHLGGTLNEYVSLSPFSMLYWEMIKTAKENNLKYVHVGGGATANDNDKLFIYKQHFSDLKGEFYIGKKVHNQLIYNSIIEQWKANHPGSYHSQNNKILGYREI